MSKQRIQGPADRATSYCKRSMRDWTAEGNDIVNAADIFKALTVENETVKVLFREIPLELSLELKGLSTYHCTFINNTTKCANVFPGISQFFSFDFEVFYSQNDQIFNFHRRKEFAPDVSMVSEKGK